MASPFEERLVKAFRCSSNAHCRFGFKNPFLSNTKNTIPKGIFLENVLLRWAHIPDAVKGFPVLSEDNSVALLPLEAINNLSTVLNSIPVEVAGSWRDHTSNIFDALTVSRSVGVKRCSSRADPMAGASPRLIVLVDSR